jgi:LPS sulfotransferase NodH
MSNRFVIFCFPRTGSYLLTDILNKQEGVTCHEEIFKKNRVELDEQYRDQLGLSLDDMEKRDADPLTYLEAVYEMSPGPVTGFKIFPAHNRQILLKLMYDTSIKKVFLARNPVQSYISTLVARETGAWTKTHHDKPDTEVQVEFPINGFIRRIHEQRKFFERIVAAIKLTAGNPFHIIDYSELKDPARMQLLAEYLGIGTWNDDVIPKYNKQIVKPYSEIVADWDRAKDTFRLLGVDETSTFFDFMTAYNEVIYSNTILAR